MTHCFENNGYNIVMDVESGAVHLCDDLVLKAVPAVEDILENDPGADRDTILAALEGDKTLEGYSAKDIGEALDDILFLKENGTLFTKDTVTPEVFKTATSGSVVKALCLNVAHDCNLRCRYCFADEGGYHGSRSLMDFQTGKAALDFLIKGSGTRRNLEVDFFGGEPLLNFEVVKQLVAYGRSVEKEAGKNFRFTLTTNGLLLDDEKLDFINKEMSNLVLSIDGRKDVHDGMRKDAGGNGSYERILPKLLNAAESRGRTNYYVRGTYTRANLDFASDVMHLRDLGFENISVEPVVAPLDEDYALQKEDIPFLLEQYDRLSAYMLDCESKGEPFNFFHFNIDLDAGPCVVKRLRGCGAGCDYLCVTPNGDLYPCHQFAGNSDFLMGNVFEGIARKDIKEKFGGLNVYSRDECAGCFARHYCSGGCAANAYNFTGSVNGVYDIGCALQKKRVECAVMLAAARKDLRDREEQQP